MNMLEEKIEELDKRLKYQELLHREVNPRTNSFVHWDNTHTLVVLSSVILSACVTLILLTKK